MILCRRGSAETALHHLCEIMGKLKLAVNVMIVTRALEAKDSRHVILRHHANAARASIALGTLPQVVQLCFPGMRLKQSQTAAVGSVGN